MRSCARPGVRDGDAVRSGLAGLSARLFKMALPRRLAAQNGAGAFGACQLSGRDAISPRVVPGHVARGGVLAACKRIVKAIFEEEARMDINTDAVDAVVLALLQRDG